MLPTLLTLTTLCLLGCKDDPEDTGPDDTGTGDGGTEAFLLGVYLYDPGTAEGDPVAGVAVAFDTTDGERLEAVSGEDGWAVVELDWDRFASAIAHADGRSFCVVTADAAAFVFEDGSAVTGLPSWSIEASTALPVGGSGWAPVSGALLHKVADAHPVVVRATTSPVEFFEADGPTSYALDVPTGQAFSLVALEFEEDEDWGEDRVIAETFHRWAVVEQPAIGGPTTVDLDFAAEVDALSLEGNLEAPADTILAEQGYLYIILYSGQAYSGFSPSTSPGVDGKSYDFRLEYVDVPGASLVTSVDVYGPDGSFSSRRMDGDMPGEGAQDLGLLSPPRRSAPVGEGPFAWEEPLSWTNPPEGDRFLFYFAQGGQIGLVSGGAEQTGFALPPLPSTSTTLTTGDIMGVLAAVSDLDMDGNPELQAWDASFLVTSPFAP